MMCRQRVAPKVTPMDGREAENGFVCLGRLGVRHMAHIVVMAHYTRLLTAALYADEYLVFQIKGTIG
jgi:hypothetical protein